MSSAEAGPVWTAAGRYRGYRLEWWHVPVYLLLALQVLLFAVPHVAPGPAGLICWLFGSDRILWMGIAVFWTLIGLVVCNYRRPFRTPWRVAAFAGLGLLFLSPWTYRAYPSSHDGQPSEVEFRLPLDGPIRVAWGGGEPDVNYHVISPAQKWAYDLLVTEGDSSHRGTGERLEDYYIYGRPVLSPADGEVVFTRDSDPDMPPGQLGGGTDPGGNQVILKIDDHEYVFLCHLKSGSVAVKAGDRVRAGDRIALVGNSGNTSEPHLHIHLQDTDDLLVGEGIPMPLSGYRTVDGGQEVARGIPTGGIARGQFVGQVVEHTGPPADPAGDGDGGPGGELTPPSDRAARPGA